MSADGNRLRLWSPCPCIPAGLLYQVSDEQAEQSYPMSYPCPPGALDIHQHLVDDKGIFGKYPCAPAGLQITVNII